MPIKGDSFRIEGDMLKLFSLEGRAGVVTGSNGQIGQAFLQALTAQGAKILATDMTETGRTLVDVEFVQADIRDNSDVNRVMAIAEEKYGRCDFLVNNAGSQVFSHFTERSQDEISTVMDVNLRGTFNCIQSFVTTHERLKQTSACIVNIASLYGVVSPDFRLYSDTPRHSSEIYGATKAGVIQMTKYFAVHLAQHGIRTNCISPGGMFNPQNPQGEKFRENYSDRCPLRRMGLAEELVGGLIYLLSDASTYTNGHNLVIDGGFTSW